MFQTIVIPFIAHALLLAVLVYSKRNSNKYSKLRGVCGSVLTVSVALWLLLLIGLVEPVQFEGDMFNGIMLMLAPIIVFSMFFPYLVFSVGSQYEDEVYISNWIRGMRWPTWGEVAERGRQYQPDKVVAVNWRSAKDVSRWSAKVVTKKDEVLNTFESGAYFTLLDGSEKMVFCYMYSSDDLETAVTKHKQIIEDIRYHSFPCECGGTFFKVEGSPSRLSCTVCGRRAMAGDWCSPSRLYR